MINSSLNKTYTINYDIIDIGIIKRQEHHGTRKDYFASGYEGFVARRFANVGQRGAPGAAVES